jgi:hypothetical protein
MSVTPNLTVTSFAERGRIVKELQAACTRAEKGETIDLKRAEEKLAGLAQQLHKDGEAIHAGTRIPREIRKEYELQKSAVTALNSRVSALSAKTNITPASGKPAVYKILTVGALAIALFIIHKILSSPPSPQPPPLQTPSSPQPVCKPNPNPFISDFCLLQDQAPTPQSMPLGNAPTIPSPPIIQTAILSFLQPPSTQSPQPVYNPNYNQSISDLSLLQSPNSTPQSPPQLNEGGNRQTFIKALNTWREEKNGEDEYTNTTGSCSIYGVKSVEDHFKNLKAGQCIREIRDADTPSEGPLGYGYEKQSLLSKAQDGYYSRGIEWLNDCALSIKTIPVLPIFLSLLISMQKPIPKWRPNVVLALKWERLTYNNLKFLNRLYLMTIRNDNLIFMNKLWDWIFTHFNFDDIYYLEKIKPIIFSLANRIQHLEQLNRLRDALQSLEEDI